MRIKVCGDGWETLQSVLPSRILDRGKRQEEAELPPKRLGHEWELILLSKPSTAVPEAAEERTIAN